MKSGHVCIFVGDVLNIVLRNDFRLQLAEMPGLEHVSLVKVLDIVRVSGLSIEGRELRANG